MKRAAAIAIVLVISLTATLSRSHAQGGVVKIGSSCYQLPAYTPVSCLLAAPTAPPITPDKSVSVTRNANQPDGIASYTINITSRAVCFPLNEPIYVYTWGNPGGAVLSPATPSAVGLQNPNVYQVTVGPDGTAALSLEVGEKYVGPSGLRLKAVWPQEYVERIVSLYEPATPTPTDTPAPNSTATATAVPASPTSTAGATTPLPTDTPVASGPIFVRTCVDPNPAPAGGAATAYIQSLPGAVCSAAIQFDDGTTIDAVTQTLSTGLGGYDFTVSPTATQGLVDATCQYGGQSATSTTYFPVQ